MDFKPIKDGLDALTFDSNGQADPIMQQVNADEIAKFQNLLAVNDVGKVEG